jgi:hypothetical protein
MGFIFALFIPLLGSASAQAGSRCELDHLKAKNFAMNAFVTKHKNDNVYYQIEKIRSYDAHFPSGEPSILVSIDYRVMLQEAAKTFSVECGKLSDTRELYCFVN